VTSLSAAGDPGSLRRAAAFYEQATALDPAFAVAWARLAEMHARLFGIFDPQPASAETARSASERAVSLAPASPEAWSARAIYYQFVPRDIPRAAEAVAQGLRLAPDDATLLTTAGAVEAGLGRWDSALVHLERAGSIDPRSPETARARASVLNATRHFGEARAVLDQALAIEPSNLPLRLDRVSVELAAGRLDSARAILRQAPASVSPTAVAAFVGTWDDLYWVLDDAQQQLLLRLGDADFDGSVPTRLVVIAQTRWVRGDTAGARLYADSAEAAFRRQAAAAPNDPQVHLFRGLSLAYLGRKAEAIREAERGAAILPLSKDAAYGAYMQHQLMRVYLVTGEYDKALDILERLLSIPYLMTPAWTRIDPNFMPVRGNPRFEKIAAR
jgi:tetratricopeptide (TPR) repeat protein